MKRSGSKTSNMAIALVATYMLVLQALFGAFALGAAAASPLFDDFGNPLCITSGQLDERSPAPIDHSALPDCCTIVCSMFAPSLAGDRDAHSLENLLVFITAEPIQRFSDVARNLTLEPGPNSPRAPPLTV